MAAGKSGVSFLTVFTLATAATENVMLVAEPVAKDVESESAPHGQPVAGAIDGRVEVMHDAHDLIPPEPGEEPLTDAMLNITPSKYASRRTKWQREVDLLEIAECLLKRMTATETKRLINNRLRNNNAPYELSYAQVRSDGKEVQRRWTEEFVGGTAKMRKAAELAFLDRIEREAWEVYSRTLRDDQSGSQVTSGTAAEVNAAADRATGRSVNITKTVAKAQRDGEVGPLLLLLKISEHRARLLGFNNVVEATEVADSSKQARFDSIRKAFAAKVLRDHAAKEREAKMLADADAAAHAQTPRLQSA